jgi:hypothetical protein
MSGQSSLPGSREAEMKNQKRERKRGWDGGIAGCLQPSRHRKISVFDDYSGFSCCKFAERCSRFLQLRWKPETGSFIC